MKFRSLLFDILLDFINNMSGWVANKKLDGLMVNYDLHKRIMLAIE